jgi:hypothetical protein
MQVPEGRLLPTAGLSAAAVSHDLQQETVVLAAKTSPYSLIPTVVCGWLWMFWLFVLVLAEKFVSETFCA